MVLEAVPPLPPGKTAGALFVDSTTTLEMGAVAQGANTTKTITLKNTDDTATSLVPLRLATTNAAFQFRGSSPTLKACSQAAKFRVRR